MYDFCQLYQIKLEKIKDILYLKSFTIKTEIEVDKLWPRVRTRPLPVFINKSKLDHGHAHAFPTT